MDEGKWPAKVTSRGIGVMRIDPIQLAWMVNQFVG